MTSSALGTQLVDEIDSCSAGVTEWLEPLEIEFELTWDGRCVFFADSQPSVIELLVIEVVFEFSGS